MSGTPCEVKAPAPCSGSILMRCMTGLLGYSAAEVEALRAKGALGLRLHNEVTHAHA